MPNILRYCPNTHAHTDMACKSSISQQVSLGCPAEDVVLVALPSGRGAFVALGQCKHAPCASYASPTFSLEREQGMI